ncbi:TolC family protein [Sediminibacterium soli]|uniref:TolC family protein n=1 Tax=Sediminibacterium soli TaxID=2698829 RepID=UPI00137B2E3C|nr:efflux transporter outer membrane subunit [Sediminibacterium soli]NCI46409.1 efflux transporter outer membrane subunit [Sediminibacterium soli]
MNKYILINRNRIIVAAIAAAVLFGCKAIQPAAYTKPALAVPDSFQTSGPVHSGERITKQLVFTDTLLVALINTAIAQNPDILIAMQRIEAMRGQLAARKGAMAPVVGADISASAQRYGDYTMEGVGNFDTNLSGNIKASQKAPVPVTPNYFTGLRSSWEIDLWGKLKQQKRSAYLQLLASEQGKKFVITSLVSEIAGRYYALQALDAKLAIIQSNIALQDSVVSISQVQKEAGRTTELGVQQFKAQALRTRSMTAEIAAERIRIENELAYLMGGYPQKIQPQPVAPEMRMVTRLSGAPQDLIDLRPDVAEAELLLQAKGADLVAARAEMLPSLNLGAFLGFNAFSGALLFQTGSVAYGLAGGLTAPLLNKRAIKGQITRTEAEKQQALQQYRKTVLLAFGEIQTSLQTIEQLEKMYALNKQETTVLSGAINISNELYKAGYASYLEVITAQKTALEAELNLIETQKRMYGSLIGLYRAVGGGW